MKWSEIAKTVIAPAVATLLGAAHLSAAELEPGDAAPKFKLPGTDGKTYALDDFRGKRAVVIAWFPMAFTPG